MSNMETANLQMLAKFWDAQREWMTMSWNAQLSFPILDTTHSTAIDERAAQLPLPGFPPQRLIP